MLFAKEKAPWTLGMIFYFPLLSLLITSNLKKDKVVAIWNLTEPSFYYKAVQIGINTLIFQNVQ